MKHSVNYFSKDGGPAFRIVKEVKASIFMMERKIIKKIY